jgi:hypothetical protein
MRGANRVCEENPMLKRILIALGLRSAPRPVRSYFAVSSFFGAVPALAWVAWKNREQIRPLLQRVTSRGDREAITTRGTA